MAGDYSFWHRQWWDLDYLVGNWEFYLQLLRTFLWVWWFWCQWVLRNNSCYRKGGKLLSILGMDDLAEQFSGMIKRNLNPIRHSRGKRGYLVHMLSNAKSFEVHNLKSGYLKKIRTENSLLFHFRMIYKWLQLMFCEI
jgi:hypothetical protein